MAKTMTDSTTDAWVTESPIKYEASATSSSSYTSPQAAQTNTPLRTRNRPVACRTGSRAAPPAPPRPPDPPGPAGPCPGCAEPGGAEPGGAGACGSITLRRYVTPSARSVTHTCGVCLHLTDFGMSKRRPAGGSPGAVPGSAGAVPEARSHRGGHP